MEEWPRSDAGVVPPKPMDRRTWSFGALVDCSHLPAHPLPWARPNEPASIINWASKWLRLMTGSPAAGTTAIRPAW